MSESHMNTQYEPTLNGWHGDIVLRFVENLEEHKHLSLCLCVFDVTAMVAAAHSLACF